MDAAGLEYRGHNGSSNSQRGRILLIVFTQVEWKYRKCLNIKYLKEPPIRCESHRE
jgi:hypothetical protein